MLSKVRVMLNLLGETVRVWLDHKAPRLAAALAYYTAFSLAPLLILLVMIAAFVIGDSEQARELVVLQVKAAVGEQAADFVRTLADNVRPDSGELRAGAVSVIILLLGATGAFVQLQDALNTIWGVEAERLQGLRGHLMKRLLSLTMVVGIGFLFMVSLAISASISFVNAQLDDQRWSFVDIVGMLNIGLSLAVATLVLAAIFKMLPDTHIAWRDVWVGALFTAVLFTVGKEVLGIYLGGSPLTSVYGAAGFFVGILAWVYYSAQILFFGAEFTQVYARRRDRGAVEA